jgi:Ni/Fe-hydrogenase subunit HybB-like protein
MSGHEVPTPIKAPFFTKGTSMVFIVMIAGFAALAARFIWGIGAITNLNNGYGWGIWIAIDVACGVALAAGGFTTAALADIFHKEKYHVITRPALLTAMLGYTFVAIGVMTDLGRWYNIWHPVMPSMWQGNSVLFEVGLCVMCYLTVLYIEFLPIVVERFKDRVNFPEGLKWLNRPANAFLWVADNTLGRVTSLFIIAGVVLSCLHQSSLGTLMVLVPTKMHPLWYTHLSPLLFLISAIMVGFPMVVFESILASRSFKLKPETGVLGSIARYTPFILGVYLALKVGDITVRNAWSYAFKLDTPAIMWWVEMLVGVVAPLVILYQKKLRYRVGPLFTGATLVIIGVVLNRINVFLVAYTPLYQDKPYFPTVYEILVTAGFIAALVLLYRLFVRIFPIISVPADQAKKEVGQEPFKTLQTT